MTTGTTFPAPNGVTSAHPNLRGGATSKNFVLDPGLHVISLEFHEATQNVGGDQVIIQSVISGTTTAVLTMNVSGYYNFVVPPGPSTTYNFTSPTNGCRNVRATRMDLSIGPS